MSRPEHPRRPAKPAKSGQVIPRKQPHNNPGAPGEPARRVSPINGQPPPQNTHGWKPGQSGNPAGRQPISLTAMLRRALAKQAPGQTAKTVGEALIESAISTAMLGDARMMVEILKRIDGEVPRAMQHTIGLSVAQVMDALDECTDGLGRVDAGAFKAQLELIATGQRVDFTLSIGGKALPEPGEVPPAPAVITGGEGASG